MQRRTIIIAAIIFAVVAFAAPVENVISFQGKLVEAGVPVDGTRNIEFKLYDVETGGTALWTENHLGVTVAGGLFNVELGGASTFDAAGVDFSEQYWLTFTVDGGAEITPRYKLTGTPYAMADGDWVIDGTDMYSGITGNVGIGTTSPESKLSVNGDGDSRYGIYSNGTSTADGSAAIWAEQTGTGAASNNFYGLYASCSTPTSDAYHTGVKGIAYFDPPILGFNRNYGVYGEAGNAAESVEDHNYGVYGKLSGIRGGAAIYGTCTAERGLVGQWAGYFDGDVTITGRLCGEYDIGTAGQILSTTGTGTLDWIDNTDGDWTVSGSDIYSAVSGKVGIGTSSPGSRLHVVSGNAEALAGYYNMIYNNYYPVQGTYDDGTVLSSGSLGLYNFDGDGTAVGVYGIADDAGTNYGVQGVVYGGGGSSTDTSYAIYGKVHSGSGHPTWAGYFEDGQVEIFDAPDDALVISSPGADGLYIKYATDNGIEVYYCDGTAALDIYNSGFIANQTHGIRIRNNDGTTGITGDGVNISHNNDDGVDVSDPSGDCFVCEGSPVTMMLFRVSNQSDIFGRFHYSYICEADGIGYQAPHSASTVSCLDHIGGGISETKIDLPTSFIESTTIDSEHPMRVFITPTSPLGDYWVEKGDSWFVVHGNRGATFDFKAQANTKGAAEIAPVNIQQLIDEDAAIDNDEE